MHRSHCKTRMKPGFVSLILRRFEFDRSHRLGGAVRKEPIDWETLKAEVL